MISKDSLKTEHSPGGIYKGGLNSEVQHPSSSQGPPLSIASELIAASAYPVRAAGQFGFKSTWGCRLRCLLAFAFVLVWAASHASVPSAPQASTGCLSEIQDPDSTTRYQRDVLGRITRKTQTLASTQGTGDTRSTTYTYVPAGQGGAGQLASITYPSGRQLTHQYDATGQLTGLQWRGQPLIQNLTWTPLGQPSGWQWSAFSAGGGSTPLTEQRSYNSAGQLTASALLDLTWDVAGRISRVTQQHMLPTASASTPQQASLTSAYSYDATGRLTASAHSAPPGLTLPTGWSLSDTTGPGSMGYAWDANGNRTQAYYSTSSQAGTATLQRDYQASSGSNRISGYSQTYTPAGGSAQTSSVAYTHDATGALKKKGDHHLHQNAQGRIAKASLSSDPNHPQAVSYTYNALSQRILKTDTRLSTSTPTAEQTVYADDGIGSTVLGQYSNRRSSNSAAPQGENDSTEIIYLPTAAGPMPIAAQINGRLYAIDADHLNTPRRLTNQQGQVAWQWLITGFGEVKPTMGSTGYTQANIDNGKVYSEAVTFNLRYPGQQWDEETQLSYNLNRYYDPPIGRYIQSDLIGLDGGANRFVYAGGDPLSRIDPLGLADMNIFSPNDRTPYSGANKWNPMGYFSVAGHGNGSIITNLDRNNRIVYSPEELAEVIRLHPQWTGQPVILGACNTGAGFDYNSKIPFAQRLANSLGVSVTAPNNLVWYDMNGMLGVGNRPPLLPFLDSTFGDWKIFKPASQR